MDNVLKIQGFYPSSSLLSFAESTPHRMHCNLFSQGTMSSSKCLTMARTQAFQLVAFQSPLGVCTSSEVSLHARRCGLRHGSSRLAKRRVTRCVATPTEQSNNSDDVDGSTWDELVSDETHVVVDGAEIAHLIDELRLSGRDSMGGLDDESELGELDGRLLNLAERRADERDGRAESVGVKNDYKQFARLNDGDGSGGTQAVSLLEERLKKESEQNGESETGEGVMRYFADENVSLMPSWAREMYTHNTHKELEDGAQRLVPDTSRRRLHDILASGPRSIGENEDDMGPSGRGGAAGGLVDCHVRDVADDYHVPEELVVDAMVSFGVGLPISSGQSVRDSMTTDEIERLLKLISSFDAADLADRYSDRTIEEVAEDYDLDASDILKVCEKEGLYVHAGAETKLSVVREDRVLDILLKGAPFGQPYPPLLDGLE